MLNAQIVAINALSAASSHDSDAIQASQLWGMSVQAIVSGATNPVGTVKIQFSNDSPRVSPTNWTDISGATVSISANGVVGIPKTDLAYEWVRVVYTHSSGTGGLVTVNVAIMGV